MVTTRDANVVSALQNFSTYPLERMSADDCWSLFLEYAFSGENCNARSQFEDKTIRSETVKKCDGLPLAARSLGSLLKSQTNVKEWTEILKSNLWNQRIKDVLPALRVSYDHFVNELYIPN